MNCSVNGCGSPATRRSMCNLHYRRLRKYGDPLKLVNRPQGTGSVRTDGYTMLEINGRAVLRHIHIAETALGKRLPAGAEVHHVDRGRGNDAPTNLVICPSRAYHKLLHIRTEALEACGDPNWRKCHICKRYDDPRNLRLYEPSKLVRHIECWRERCAEKRRSA